MKREKGVFTLKTNYTTPTNTSMYECVRCTAAGLAHHIIDAPGPPAQGNEVSIRGQATTIRVCTGCDRYDGPWVEACY